MTDHEHHWEVAGLERNPAGGFYAVLQSCGCGAIRRKVVTAGESAEANLIDAAHLVSAAVDTPRLGEAIHQLDNALAALHREPAA